MKALYSEELHNQLPLTANLKYVLIFSLSSYKKNDPVV